MNIIFEYIIFIVIVLYFTLQNYIKSKKEIKESSSIIKNSISITESKDKEINGIYNSVNELFNQAVVYKHEINEYWIYKVIEIVSEKEENCYWILGNKNPNTLNESRCPDNNIIFHSVSVVDIGDFYVYQYIDFGNSITSDDLILFNKLDEKIMIKIIINK
jgi:hypothetical protein